MKWLCMLMLIAAGFHVSAQPPATDTVTLNSLPEVIALAIKTNPTQAIYQQQVKQAVYNYKASKGYLYPNISGSFNGQDNLHLGVTPIPGILINQPGTTYYAQFGKQYVYNTGITVNENIFNWTSIFQSSIAKSNVALAQVQQASYLQSLKEQAARLYYSVLIAKASLQTTTHDLALADSLVSLSKQRLQQGTADALSVNQALINYNNVLQNQAQSQQMYDQGIENLKILLGEKVATGLKISEQLSLDSIAGQGIARVGTDRNLDVYRQQAEVASLQSRQQRAVAYPSLGLNGYFGAQQFRNDFGLGLGSGAWNAYRYVGLSINVPIFTGFSNASKYHSALVQKQIAQLQYQDAQAQSSGNDELLIKNLNNYTHMATASANSYTLYRTNVQLNRQKYQEGIINMDIYLKAFEDYLRAENTHLNNLSQLFSTRATIISRN